VSEKSEVAGTSFLPLFVSDSVELGPIFEDAFFILFSSNFLSDDRDISLKGRS